MLRSTRNDEGPGKVAVVHVSRVCVLVLSDGEWRLVFWLFGCGRCFPRLRGRGLVLPNVRAKRATTAGRQARACENVPSTTGPGLVACRWRSA
jgi:hypothetical protein